MIKISAGSSVRLVGQLGVDLAGRTVAFRFEPVLPTAPDSEGYVVALGGGGQQTRSAAVLDAPGGLAQYTLTSADTMAAGTYRAQFTFVDGDGALQVFPATGYILFEVQEFVAPTVFSALTDFCEPVRAIMGDFRTPFMFEGAAVTGVVRTVVRCGHLPGFAVTADALGLAPAVTDPAAMALLVYHSARTLLRPNVRGESWGARALKVRRNDQKEFLRELENLVYYAENPTQFSSFQSYYAWVNSLAGINVWGLMTQMKVQGPVATAIIGTAGIQINTT